MANKVFKGVKSTLLPDTYVNSPVSVAPLFSASTAYAKGDQVYNGLKLYRFTANHAAGAWTGSDVEEVTVGGQLKTLNDDTTSLKQDLEGLDVYTLGLYPQMSVEDTAVASFTDGADNIPVKSLTVDITPVQSGTGDPSPSNVRPISGWTGATVNVKGFNQFDGEWVTDFGYHVAKNYMSVIPGQTYYVYAPHVPSGQSVYADEYGADKTLISSSVNIGRIGAYTVPSGVYYMKIRVWGEFDYSELCFNISDQSKNGTYEPYKGNVYSISFPSTAGTVYGGTLDVTNGVLTVTNGYADMGTLTWTYEPGANPSLNYFECGLNPLVKNGTTNLICSKYPIGNVSYASGDDHAIMATASANHVRVRDTSYTDAATFKTAMSGVQLVYELATPQTYQLNPTEVTTLLKNNNLFADTGNVNSLTYRADLKAYIDEKLA